MLADSPHLYLTGYRGTGKSTVSKLLGEALSLPVWDSDREIETRSNSTIKAIFEQRGEAAFRDLEETVVRDLSSGETAIIALGGGAILRKSTRETILETGLCVWLTASPHTLSKRIQSDSGSHDTRPALTTEQSVLREIENVLNARLPLYQQASDFEISTESAGCDTLAQQIADWYRTQSWSRR